MALIKFKGLNKLEKSVRDRIEKELTNKRMLNEVGGYIVKNIAGSARKGKDINTGENYDKLKASTVRTRNQLAKKNTVDSLAKGITSQDNANKSLKQRIAAHKRSKKGSKSKKSSVKANHTFTGELLKSIKFKTDSKKPLLSITAEGTHKTYRGGSKKAVTNKQLITWLHFGTDNMVARPIMGVSKKMSESVNVIINKHLRKALSKK